MEDHKRRYDIVDIVKFIAAILVICVHCAPLVDINKEANFFLVQVLARFGVPLFFMLSAYFFFRKIDLSKGSKDQNNHSYLGKYLLRLLKVYVIWMIIYLPFSGVLIYQQGNGLMGIVGYIRDIFFNGSFYHLWFLPALMFGTVIVYYLSMKLQTKYLLIICFVLYVMGMLGNVYGSLLADMPMIGEAFNAYLKIFTTTRNGLFFAPIFISIGYYLAQHQIKKQQGLTLLCLLVSFSLLVGEVYLSRFMGFDSPLASMFIALVPCVSFLGIYLFSVDYVSKYNLSRVRAMTLLIYVSHCLFTTLILWVVPNMNSLLGFVVVLVLSVLLSASILVLSNKFKFLKMLY